MILIYITCKDKKEVIKLSTYLLQNKLAACTNFYPIKSMYFWNNQLETSSEYALLVKTENNKYNKIKAEIKKIHSYEVPCIMKINVEFNKDYEQWLKDSII